MSLLRAAAPVTLLVLAAPALVSTAALADVSVTALPGPARARLLSGDGGTAAGDFHPYMPPFGVRWDSLGGQSSAGISVPSALSFDGSAVGGTQWVNDGVKHYTEHAAISRNGSLEILPFPSGISASEGGLMSGDANTLVVRAVSGAAGDYLWRRGQGYVATITGMDSLDAMSGDGSTIVGRSSNSTASYWRESGGVQLIPPPGSTYSQARAVTPDGSIIVGTTNVAGAGHAFIWDAAQGARVLTSASGPSLDVANGISADGSVIVGYGGAGATVWTPSGAYLLQDLLHGAGIHDLDGYNGLDPIGVSTDGTKLLVVSDFGGLGGSGQWIVMVPGPGAGFAAGLLVWSARRRRPAG